MHRRNSFRRFSHEVQRPYHVFYIKRHTEAFSFTSESMTVERREDYTRKNNMCNGLLQLFYAFYIIWCFSKLLPHTRQHIPFIVKGISQRTNPKKCLISQTLRAYWDSGTLERRTGCVKKRQVPEYFTLVLLSNKGINPQQRAGLWFSLSLDYAPNNVFLFLLV